MKTFFKKTQKAKITNRLQEKRENKAKSKKFITQKTHVPFSRTTSMHPHFSKEKLTFLWFVTKPNSSVHIIMTRKTHKNPEIALRGWSTRPETCKQTKKTVFTIL
jgi:hypothetical protein